MSFLFAESPLQRFGEAQEPQLLAYLESLTSCSAMQQIVALRELQLDAGGKTAMDGRGYTRWAMWQVCQRSCPGLYKVVLDLDAAGSQQGLSTAVAIFNSLVDLRFTSKLYGCQSLVNTSQGLLEGVVGRTYRWASNAELYTRVADALAEVPGPLVFCGAVLAGRWLMWRYRQAEPITLPDGDVYYRGYQISNHEIGKASVRLAPFLLRQADYTASVEPGLSVSRVRHAGSKFDRAVQNAVAKMTSSAEEVDVVQGLQDLRAAKLDFPSNERQRDRRVDHWVSRCRSLQLDTVTARAAVLAALQQGADEPRATLAHLLTASQLASRSQLDLYVAMGREAKKLPVYARERLERAAGLLLFERKFLD